MIASARPRNGVGRVSTPVFACGRNVLKPAGEAGSQETSGRTLDRSESSQIPLQLDDRAPGKDRRVRSPMPHGGATAAGRYGGGIGSGGTPLGFAAMASTSTYQDGSTSWAT